MLILLKKIYRKIKRIILGNTQVLKYDFNKSNPLGDNGERVDIQLNAKVSFRTMDMYQKNHWKRYQFAKTIINTGDICADFACGTGYGSILIAENANTVIGVDLNEKVIKKIKERYSFNNKVIFLNKNLLNLTYKNYFDKIVSFETLEHFNEPDLKKLLLIFNRALKKKGKLIFSTPYMQEDSAAAISAGFHLTYFINEEKIINWMQEAGFTIESFQYQNYDTHCIESILQKKDFLIGVAFKNN